MQVGLYPFCPSTFDPCSGTTLLLSEYRDKRDSLNYVTAGGCTSHVILAHSFTVSTASTYIAIRTVVLEINARIKLCALAYF